MHSDPHKPSDENAAAGNRPAAAAARHNGPPPSAPKEPNDFQPSPHAHHQTFWLWVMCLTGVDYFSTLGYQPSIAFESAGVLAPVATIVLVAVTLFGALPVYAHVAECSPYGQGSIAMLERLVHGWNGKLLVLALLGFAATDFVITKTLSAADAAVHLIHNPLWNWAPPFIHHFTEDHQRLGLTMLLLVILGASFMRGFREVIGLAVVVVAVYLSINLLVVGSGVVYLVTHPHAFDAWYQRLITGDWHIAHRPFASTGTWAIVATSIWFFPKLALGLSGFETGVAVMPLIRGDESDSPHEPQGRIRNTRKLLATSAVIMSVFLIGSALVTATLIPPDELIHIEDPAEAAAADAAESKHGGRAADRALAYLAHGESPHPINPLFGPAFGTMYDLATVVILSFAGLSAMAGLLNLVPQYLPRYGMAPEWTRAVKPLVLLFTAINLTVTWIFNADVEAQGGAYATGVLVLICSACVATVIERYRQQAGSWLRRLPWRYLLITLVFFFTTGANMIERPDGLKIASCFILTIVAASFISRVKRSTELRFGTFEFHDPNSPFLWDSLKMLEFPVLVPHRPGRRQLEEKEASIRLRHRLGPDVPIVFVEATLEDPSEFEQNPLMEVKQEEGRFVIKVTRCASIAHALATIALELSRYGKPPEIHFGWSDDNPLAAAIGFFLLGEGNVPWRVRELINKAEPDPHRRPRVIIG